MKVFMFCILHFVATYLATSSDAAENFRSDYVFSSEINGYLKYQEIPANFREARLRCHLEGAKLASPITSELRNVMLRAMENNSNFVLTGISSLLSDGYYFSMEGVPLAEIPHTWAQGEPNNKKDEEGCIVMLWEGSFAVVNCTKKISYMCYKEKTSEMVMTECGTTDKEYTFDSRTGSCYKVHHKLPRTWHRAYQTCAAEGGYLAVIDNEKEADVLAEHLRKHAPQHDGWAYHVGFLDWDEDGEWETIHGDAITTKFDKFSYGNPSYSPELKEYCGGLFRSGLLDNICCEYKAQFICEKDPGNWNHAILSITH